jgi:ACS family tartrate transporter-like MFS transporter
VIDQDKVFAKCAWRLIPFMMLLYIVNYLDRVNVGFAALTMNRDLGFSPSIYGFAAGIFFVSYAIFQVPANVILERVGARRAVFCIMAAWGLLSAVTAFVHSPASFYILRFLLGVSEAGFFPGMLLYISLWFPSFYRARLTAIFMTAGPFSFIFGGPLSGSILGMEGTGGFHGWQWLFLIEGLPACLLALAALRGLPDGPVSASWLSVEEKKTIDARIRAEDTAVRPDFWTGLRDPRVLLLGMAGIGAGAGVFGGQLWMPQIVQSMGFSHIATSFIVVLPAIAGLVAMVLCGYSSDLNNERIWHVAIPWLVAATGFAVASVGQSDVLVIGGLAIAGAALYAGQGTYYYLSSSFLRGPAAAGSIALVNVMCTGIGGLLGPNIIGLLRQYTGGYAAGLAALAGGMVASVFIVLILARVIAARTVHAAVAP